jgi:hypothetical protein
MPEHVEGTREEGSSIVATDQDRPDAHPPVPPDQEPGEPGETIDERDPGSAAKEREAEAEEARVDAAPREIT